MIKNIGLLWNEADVFWGASGHRGTLLGLPTHNLTAGPVDFREQIGIYVLYADFEIVYVGQTGTGSQRLWARLRAHRRDDLAGRWNKFSWFGMRVVRSDCQLGVEGKRWRAGLAEVLNQMEAIIIHTAEPPLNRQGGRFGDEVEWYVQHRDKRLGPTQEEMVKDIWQSLEL